MKKLALFLLPLGLCLAVGFIPGSSSSPSAATRMWNESYMVWRLSLEAMHTTVDQAASTESVEKLELAYVRSRAAFKRIEFLMVYLDPEAHKDYINGAPLLHLERKAPDLVILEPKGYQPLDELLYGEAPLEALKEMEKLIGEMEAMGERMGKGKGVIRDFQLFEASRNGLVSLFTLGLTGFDTPSSGLAMADARNSWGGMRDFMATFQDRIRSRDAALADRIERTWAEGDQVLGEAYDFDQFDRLHFLRTYLNPLYRDLLEAQNLLGIELPHEVNPLPRATNYSSTNLFAEDYLNPWFFSKLPANQQVTERTELGKLLFFDPVLSEATDMACATCHHPQQGFAEAKPKSLARGGQGTIQRNSMGLVNAVYANRYFHDLRTEQLKKQVAHVVFNTQEFNTSFTAIEARLNRSPEYLDLFRAAFPRHTRRPINEHTIATALAYYVQSLRGFDSPFDRYVRGETNEMSADVQRGFNLFMGKAACGTCHFAPTFNGNVPPAFNDTESEVLGVPVDHHARSLNLDPDRGRYDNQRPKERAPFYQHSFKTPTVRNIALTGPYMHNGAYATLDDVIDFYDRGGGQGMGLDLDNQTLPPDALELEEQEKKDLVAFMESLTDTTGMTSIPAQLPRFPDRPEWNQRDWRRNY